MENLFVLVEWPESQKLEDEDWFDECYPAAPLEDSCYDMAYFVPWNRYNHRAEPPDVLDIVN